MIVRVGKKKKMSYVNKNQAIKLSLFMYLYSIQIVSKKIILFKSNPNVS